MAISLRINCISFGVRLDQSNWPLWTTPLYRRPLWASMLVAKKASIEIMLKKFILFRIDDRLKILIQPKLNVGIFKPVLIIKLIMRRCFETLLGCFIQISTATKQTSSNAHENFIVIDVPRRRHTVKAPLSRWKIHWSE